MVQGVRIPEGFYVNPEAYAKQHGLSVATVKRRCARGDLKAVKWGRSWFIPTHQTEEDFTVAAS